MSLQRYLKRAIEIYANNGLVTLLFRIFTKIRLRITNEWIPLAVANDPIDVACYRESVMRLKERQAIETDLDDIVDTTGYNVIDYDAIRLEEWEQSGGPYAGLGTFPGKYSGFGHYSELLMSQERGAITGLAKAVESEEPDNVLEIGSDKGGSFYVWSRFLESADHLISLDIQRAARRGKFFKQFAPDKEITCIDGNSQKMETYERVERSLVGADVDFLYIDANHDYEAVKRDFELYSQLVADDGIVGFHDISHPGTGVPEFWEELQEEYETEEFGDGPTRNGLLWL